MEMTISTNHASQLSPIVKGNGVKVGESINITMPSDGTTMLVNLKRLTEDFFYLSDVPQVVANASPGAVWESYYTLE